MSRTAASVPLPATCPELTWLNTVNGSQAPILGLRATMMFSMKSAQMSDAGDGDHLGAEERARARLRTW